MLEKGVGGLSVLRQSLSGLEMGILQYLLLLLGEESFLLFVVRRCLTRAKDWHLSPNAILNYVAAGPEVAESNGDAEEPAAQGIVERVVGKHRPERVSQSREEARFLLATRRLFAVRSVSGMRTSSVERRAAHASQSRALDVIRNVIVLH